MGGEIPGGFVLTGASAGFGQEGVGPLHDLHLPGGLLALLTIFKMMKKARWKVLTIGPW